MAEETFSFNSDVLADGVYDEDSQGMTLNFQDGRSYTFAKLPAELWLGLKAAISPGRFFNDMIKGQFGE
jgi:hypothetical protein